MGQWKQHTTLSHADLIPWKSAQCPICLEDMPKGALLASSHLAHHLEHIAFIGFPTPPDSADGVDRVSNNPLLVASSTNDTKQTDSTTMQAPSKRRFWEYPWLKHTSAPKLGTSRSNSADFGNRKAGSNETDNNPTTASKGVTKDKQPAQEGEEFKDLIDRLKNLFLDHPETPEQPPGSNRGDQERTAPTSKDPTQGSSPHSTDPTLKSSPPVTLPSEASPTIPRNAPVASRQQKSVRIDAVERRGASSYGDDSRFSMATWFCVSIEIAG
ncbi:hypothetical protein PG997_000405 [Apiospora hydei]|uniref:Uncharacterized protein n=1 Tax=Apiospora hydei TaxID=1337664 RepID=A0ABR1XAP5_9PEZI